MAKASPARRNFNAGEFSILVEGRTDIDKYNASMRRVINGIMAPQGPFIGRSGTMFVTEVYDSSKYSTLVPFVFSEDQSLNLEFSNKKLRFIFETGLQTYNPTNVISIVSVAPQLTLQIATLSGAIGDQVALTGFNNAYNLNGRVFTIVAVAGDQYTFNTTGVFALGAVTGAFAAKVFSIVTPYTDVDARNIRAVQDQDTVYLFCDGYQPRVLSRLSALNWTLSLFVFTNGPFLNDDKAFGQLQVSGTGAPAVATPFADSGTAANAFDGDTSTYWQGGSTQTGTLGGLYAVPTVINGYVIYPAYNNTNATYAAEDFAPSSWVLEASTNTTTGLDGTWTVLDTEKNYIVYDDGRSGWFQFTNTVAYIGYRIRISELVQNGALNPCIASLVFSPAAPPTLTVAIVGPTTINSGAGFAATDVGRLLRAQSADGLYRIMAITGFVDAAHVTVQLQSEPFFDTTLVSAWSIGYYSDTTGWPVCGAFFDDRLFVGGCKSSPGLVAGSRVGVYTDFIQITPAGVVLDDYAIVALVKSRKVSDVRWMVADTHGLVVGTGVTENVLSANDPSGQMTAKNIKGRENTARGSAFLEPVKVDNNILHIDISRRNLREVSYSFQADGYTTRSLSLFASHLGIPQFTQMVYAADPSSVVWFRRDDGSVVGFTYNKDEDVLGWHTHDFSGVVESMSSIQSTTNKQNILWMVINRTIDGQTRRYVEYLTRLWDFDSNINTAHYVDAGLRYNGPPTPVLYGLWHLEGQVLSGLLDGIPYEDMLVINGAIQLPKTDTTNAVLGLPYEQYGEISRIEAGAADGTAQGKDKRINIVVPHVWDTAYGEIGVWDAEREEYTFDDIVYKEGNDLETPTTLVTEVLKPINLPPGYNNRGAIAFRQTKPLPFNLIALYPQLNTQDR